MTDAELAAEIAGEAGAVLLALQRSGELAGKALGAEGDARANAIILDRLRAARPADPILSEEAADDLARCDVRRCWIVDPLDGTSEYAQMRDDWAVHVGLSIDGEATTGAVALPARGRVLATGTGLIAPAARDRPRIVVSRSRPPAEAARVAAALGGELVPMGSAGAKAMAVVLGDADIYIHSGGQYAWDNCAPAAVARDAGLHVSRLDGSPLVYNRAETWVPDLLVCYAELATTIVDLCKE